MLQLPLMMDFDGLYWIVLDCRMFPGHGGQQLLTTSKAGVVQLWSTRLREGDHFASPNSPLLPLASMMPNGPSGEVTRALFVGQSWLDPASGASLSGVLGSWSAGFSVLHSCVNHLRQRVNREPGL